MARQPEGKIKDECRPKAVANDLIFWQIEGKSRNGVPDTLCSTVAGRALLVEFKVPGKEPNEQQWLRIYELRQAGIDAWWADCVETWEILVGLRPGKIAYVYPAKILALIELGTTADTLPRMGDFLAGMKVRKPTRGSGA